MCGLVDQPVTPPHETTSIFSIHEQLRMTPPSMKIRTLLESEHEPTRPKLSKQRSVNKFQRRQQLLNRGVPPSLSTPSYTKDLSHSPKPIEYSIQHRKYEEMRSISIKTQLKLKALNQNLHIKSSHPNESIYQTTGSRRFRVWSDEDLVKGNSIIWHRLQQIRNKVDSHLHTRGEEEDHESAHTNRIEEEMKHLNPRGHASHLNTIGMNQNSTIGMSQNRIHYNHSPVMHHNHSPLMHHNHSPVMHHNHSPGTNQNTMGSIYHTVSTPSRNSPHPQNSSQHYSPQNSSPKQNHSPQKNHSSPYIRKVKQQHSNNHMESSISPDIDEEQKNLAFERMEDAIRELISEFERSNDPQMSKRAFDQLVWGNQYLTPFQKTKLEMELVRVARERRVVLR